MRRLGAVPDRFAFRPGAGIHLAQGENAPRQPYLDWFEKPEHPNGTCMILISGGSYQNCCDGKLIQKWRTELTAKGVQCVNFVYRTLRPAAPLAKHTSAGGHLTLMGVTSSRHKAYYPIDAVDKLSCKVQWGIGIYPAYALTDGLEDPNAGGDELRQSLGKDAGDGNSVRTAHPGHPRPLLPVLGLSGNRELHLAGTRRGVR